MQLFSAIASAFRKFAGRKKPVVLAATMRGRIAVPDTADYYLGMRVRGRLQRVTETPRTFWDMADFKRGLNCGRKHPRYFVLDAAGRIVSSIPKKLMTVKAPEVGIAA